MKKYIFAARNGIYIIDLSKTVECINTAYAALKEIVDKEKQKGYYCNIE